MADELYRRCADFLREAGLGVGMGRFGADMKVRLLNDGRVLPVRFETLPGYFEMGVARGPFYSITHIPADEFPLEPMVIEIEW